MSINLETTYKFPKDSSAAILTSGLLGEQYLGLTPGSEEENFAEGGKIRYTQSAVVLEQLISKFLYGSAESALGRRPGTGQDARELKITGARYCLAAQPSLIRKY